MNKILSGSTGTVVLSEFTDGLNVVQGTTPLKYVNYFDGMLMRAELMKLEQQGHFNLSQISNQAGGHGVVWGFDTALTNGSLNLGAGMAIDTSGRVVYMPGEIDLSIDDLINKGASETTQKTTDKTIDSGFADCIQEPSGDSVTVIEGTQYYVITVGQIDALCGEEDVYGRLCEEACVTSTDRPYKIDGVVVRAEPLPSGLILPQSSAVTLSGSHLRSRIASAFFEYEQNTIKSHISGEGLAQSIWCNGARLPGGFTRGVPVGLLARQGSENLFLDRWIVTRERMETPPRRYWAHMMAMRPWNTFLAQVLQFQCQLNGLFTPGGSGIPDDPCADTKGEIKDISDKLEEILNKSKAVDDIAGSLDGVVINSKSDNLYSQIENLQFQMNAVSQLSAPLTSSNLVSRGIIETPSAGYLPVAIDDSVSVDQQVRALMGEGVDLRFCVVRPDYIPHALEEAQHMERISLLEGLDNPDMKPKVDVLVPDGFFQSENTQSQGTGYEMQLNHYNEIVGKMLDSILEVNNRSKLEAVKGNSSQEILEMFAESALADGEAEPVTTQPSAASTSKTNLASTITSGAARGVNTDSGGYAFYYAGSAKDSNNDKIKRNVGQLLEMANLEEIERSIQPSQLGIWISMSVDKDPFNLTVGQSTKAHLEIDVVFTGSVSDNTVKRYRLDSNLTLKITDSSVENIGLHASGELRLRIDNLNSGGLQENTINISNSSRIRKTASGLNQSTIASFLTGIIFNNKIDSIISQRIWTSDKSATVNLGLTVPNRKTNASALVSLSAFEGISYPIAQAEQTINPNVFKSDHPANESSIEALELISSLAKQPELSATRAQLLFDAEQTQTLSNKVFAARDWVFFHRRRDKQCEPTQPEAVQTERGYKVYTVDLTNIEDLPVVMKLISSGSWDALAKFDFSFVTEVEFNGGTQNILSSRVRLLSDWQSKVDDTTEILSGVIVNNPQWNESNTLASARINQLNSVFDDVSEIDDQAQFEALNSLPPPLAETEHGGIVYLVNNVETTCQRVVGFRSSENQQDLFAQMKRAIASGQPTNELLKQFEVQEIGIQAFKGNTVKPILNDLISLQESWNLHGNGPVSAALNITATTAEKDVSLSQANVIAKVINGSEIDTEHAVAQQGVGDCQGITILLAGNLKEHDVVRFTSVVTPEIYQGVQENFKKAGVNQESLDGTIAEATIMFDPESELIPDAQIAALYQSILTDNELKDGIEWHVTTAHKKGISDNERKAINSHMEKIGALLNPNPKVELVESATEQLPNGVEAITFVVPVDLKANFSTVVVSVAEVEAALTESRPVVAFRFDENEELIEDAHFDNQIKTLKREGIQFSEAEMFGDKKPRINDKRLTSIVEALEAKDILKVDAVKKTTKLKAAESSALTFGSFRLPEALVLR